MSSTKNKLTAQSDQSEVVDCVLYIADPADPSMDAFFTSVQNIRDMTDTIRDNIEQVREAHNIILTSTNNDERIKQRVENLTGDTDKTIYRATAELKKLQILEERDLDKASSHSRMRSIQLYGLSNNIVKLMTEYNRIKVEYRERCKAQLQRQLEIAGRQTTDEQLEEMLEQGSVAIFTQDIITETAQATQSVADIETRLTDIVKLQKSIKELHDMFVDMGMMVDNQGKLVDRIEDEVGLVKEWVKKGEDDLDTAEIDKNRALKKKIAIAACLLITILIIITCLVAFKS